MVCRECVAPSCYGSYDAGVVKLSGCAVSCVVLGVERFRAAAVGVPVGSVLGAGLCVLVVLRVVYWLWLELVG